MWKKSWLLFVLFGIGFVLNHAVFATESVQTLLEYRHDVTGDGKPEKITVYGIPFETGSGFLREIWAIIELNNGETLRIDYEGGYEPKLEFADLNHDNVDDILFSSPTGGSGGLYNYALHTVKDNKLEEIPLPSPLPIESSFQDNFKASIKIPGIEETIILDVSDRKEEYIRLGLYQKNGLLNEPMELMLDPIAMFEVIEIEGKEGYGLKSFRQVSGAYHADQLGRVEAEWYYENGEWNPIHVEWVPTGEKN